MPEHHADDEFHPRPFFRPNQGLAAAGAYLWDDTGHSTSDILHARHFWHLPLPDQPLSDLTLPNGISDRCVEPLHRYEIAYVDPDTVDVEGGGVRIELTFTAMALPNYLGASHLDRPGRYLGVIVLGTEKIPVDAFGFRDRSWGPRSQFGVGIYGTPSLRGGYSYATASGRDAFHAISKDFGSGCEAIHGYVALDGERVSVASGRRTVTGRDPGTGYPLAVELELVDGLGRALHAEGRCLNGLELDLNPNLFSINCLTEWSFEGVTAFSEDHDNWSATGIRRFLRSFHGLHGDRAGHPQRKVHVR